jgi:hypothetical protein
MECVWGIDTEGLTRASGSRSLCLSWQLRDTTFFSGITSFLPFSCPHALRGKADAKNLFSPGGAHLSFHLHRRLRQEDHGPSQPRQKHVTHLKNKVKGLRAWLEWQSTHTASSRP